MRKLIPLFLLLSSVFAENSNEALKTLSELQLKISTEKTALITKVKQSKRQLNTALSELNALKAVNFYEKINALAQEEEAQNALLNSVDDILFTLPEHVKAESLEQSLKNAFSQIREKRQTTTQTATVYDESGKAFKGKLLKSGPMMWFEDKGVVIKTGDTLQLKSEEPVNFTEVKSGKTAVPVYFSAKAAFNSPKESLIEHLKKGKVAMIPMLVLALFATVTALIRSLKLTGVVNRLYTEEITEIVSILKSEGKDKALEAASKLRRPLANVISEGIKNHDLSKEHLEEVLYERITLEVPKLEKGLAGLAVSASAAPLLGLLGTVTGMIHTFDMITTYGSGNASILSGGISEALVTTEVGLVIAIPALLMHAWLGRKVSKAIALTQKASLSFVNLLKIK